MKNEEGKDKRGLASADRETRERVASEGGSAPHKERGLQAADDRTREEVARKGGEAHHDKRGQKGSDRGQGGNRDSGRK